MSLRRILTLLILSLVILTQFVPGINFTSWDVAAATTCDGAQFISDVTIPDGTGFVAGTTFTKIWRLKNIGNCIWTTSYSADFYSGTQMSAVASVNLPTSVAPGSTVDISVNMTAPSSSGHYRSYWRLRNAAGIQFGLGSIKSATFFADINVTASTNSPVAYDFASNYCSAVWTSGAGALSCPGAEGDINGFVSRIDTPTLENGTVDSNPGLQVGPQQVAGGYIQAIYPSILVQAGDHFQSIINCSYNAQNCYVNFRLEYQIGSGPVKVFWDFFERYEGLYYQADLDLSSLAGQEVKFILYLSDVSGHGIPSGDQALWGWPRITRLDTGSVSTVQPSVTITPQPANTNTPLPTIASTATSQSQPTTFPTATSQQPQPINVPSYCNRAAFITDVTIPDGAQLAAGSAFSKTWRIKNTSFCTWSSYSAIFYGGTQIGSAIAVNLPSNVLPGATVDVTVNMVAPAAAGHYRSYWLLRNSSGTVFGLGSLSSDTFFVDIYSIVASTPSPTSAPESNPPTPTFTQIVYPPTPTFTQIIDPPTPTFTQVVNPPTLTFTNTPGSSHCNLIYNGAFEQQVLALINNERAKVGLSPLTETYALEMSAGIHSEDMVLNNFLSHTGSDGSSYWDREVRAGYTGRWGGEIIASSSVHGTPESAVAWWMNDPPHKAIILADYQDIGAGYVYCSTNAYGGFFTVDFGHR